MSTFSQTPASSLATGTPRFSPETQKPEFTTDQLSAWQHQINECQHPVIVLNSSFQPVLLNEVLRARLSEPAQTAGTGQPTAFLWQSICETASRIAAEQSRSSHGREIAQAFPIHQRCFVAVGSLIRSHSGQIMGAVLNLADLSSSLDDLQEVSSAAHDDSIDSEAFQQWEASRELARKKMSRLSRRESQVVELVADGLPNKSIAHELDISVKTIEKHRANATRKLGVGSTAEMVRIAVVAGNKTPDVQRPISEPHPPRTSPDRPF